MKKLLQIIAFFGVAVIAEAQTTNPEKVYVYGDATVNESTCTWSAPGIFDVVDNEVTLVFNNIEPGAFLNVSTCPTEDAANFNNSKIAPADMKQFNTEQGVKTGDFIIPSDMFDYNTDWTVKFVFGESPKAYVSILAKKLYIGGWQVSIDGKVPNVSENICEPVDGYFNIDMEYGKGCMEIYPTITAESYSQYMINPAEYSTESPNLTAYENLSKELPVKFGSLQLYGPYLGSFTYRIKEDLTTIELKVNEPRKVYIQVLENGYYGTEIERDDMETVDGKTYTYTFTEQNALKQDDCISIINDYAANETLGTTASTTTWRADGDISYGESAMWLTAAGDTHSRITEPFIGTVTVELPTMVTFDNGWANKYWSDKPNAKVTFTKSVQTGITDIDVAEENAPVEYFNLQGVRIANPENGMFIRRQGSKVSKVVL